ncbi:hypothetical protein SAMN06265349_102150 [Flavobacterium resistens]|uniref:Uncharacterized protein n=1 Tax=Flavobacterium resistens TaxID=443612 RepID=A0A521C2I7_9FLAO|nr:hypothetical protein SAMN06265349_102150 [Flavobacterium resistens]
MVIFLICKMLNVRCKMLDVKFNHFKNVKITFLSFFTFYILQITFYCLTGRVETNDNKLR